MAPIANSSASLSRADAPSAARQVQPPAATRLVLGLGNDILRDDAIGLRVVRELRDQLPPDSDADVLETSEMGLALLDLVVGYRELFIVDAVQTGRAEPGHLHEFAGDALQRLPRISPHVLGVGEMLAAGRELGLAMPERVRIFAVEVADPFTLDTELTPALQAALPRVTQRVIEVLRSAA
jgi:hydrogenase maturation protease